MGNLFLVSAGKLRTAPTQAELDASESLRNHVPYPRSSVLPGTTRGFILESAASMGIDVELGAIDVNQLLEADEVFITNSMMLVMPVCRIERHEVGAGKPGALTQRLMHHVRASAG
jgi:branched-subunit amino acid aminotransferase/4-amino-4-deoxychorismate lyase